MYLKGRDSVVKFNIFNFLKEARMWLAVISNNMAGSTIYFSKMVSMRNQINNRQN